MLLQSKNGTRELRLKFRGDGFVIRFPNWHPDRINRQLLKDIRTPVKSRDMIGVPVSHDDKRNPAPCSLCHIGNRGFYTVQVAGLAASPVDAAIDDYVKRLFIAVKATDQEKVPKAHPVHPYPDSHFSGGRRPGGSAVIAMTAVT